MHLGNKHKCGNSELGDAIDDDTNTHTTGTS